MNKYQILKTLPLMVPKIWGGARLAKVFKSNQDLKNKAIGEAWTLACIAEGESFVDQFKLSQLDSGLFSSSELTYLVKFIQTSDNLSVQVHPNDTQAAVLENGQGKDECWYILEARDGAGVYVGLKPGIGAAELEAEISQKSDISKLMNFVNVKAGDFINLEAGTLHAIGAGLLLIEVQQSSGITYRVWDWNRVDGNGNTRTLHLEKALQVINYEAENKLITASSDLVRGVNTNSLIEHRDYKVQKIVWNQESIIERDLCSEKNRISSIFCLNGKLELTRADESLSLKSFESAFFPVKGASKVEIKLMGEGECLFVG